MEFELKDIEPTKKSISFKFFKEEIEKEKSEVVKKIKKMATLPGFRPGKVPVDIIKARFKKEIEEDILENLTEKNIKEIIKEKNWKVVGDINISEKSIEEDYFKSVVEFFVLPKIDIPTLENIELKNEEVEVSEKEIGEEIENYRRSKGKLEESEGPIKDENYALCKLIGTYEKEEKEIDFGYQYLSPTGKDPVPELLGKNKGDEIKFSKDFPPDDPSLHRGKKVNFRTIIEEIKIFKYPELDIELIKKDFPNLNSLEEFKDFVKNKILEKKKKTFQEKLKEDLLNQLLAKVEIPIPQPLLEIEKKKYIQEKAMALYEKNYDVNKLDWKNILKDYEPKAIKKLQKFLLLDAFSESLKVEATDEEVLNDIRKFCEINDLDYDEKIKEYRKSGTFEDIRFDIKMEKTIDKILEIINLNLQK